VIAYFYLKPLEALVSFSTTEYPNRYQVIAMVELLAQVMINKVTLISELVYIFLRIPI